MCGVSQTFPKSANVFKSSNFALDKYFTIEVVDKHQGYILVSIVAVVSLSRYNIHWILPHHGGMRSRSRRQKTWNVYRFPITSTWKLHETIKNYLSSKINHLLTWLQSFPLYSPKHWHLQIKFSLKQQLDYLNTSCFTLFQVHKRPYFHEPRNHLDIFSNDKPLHPIRHHTCRFHQYKHHYPNN